MTSQSTLDFCMAVLSKGLWFARGRCFVISDLGCIFQERESAVSCTLQCCHLSMTSLIRTKSTNHEPCHDTEKDRLALGIWFTKGDWQLCDPLMDRKPAAAGHTRFFANVLQTGKHIDVLLTGLNNCQL